MKNSASSTNGSISNNSQNNQNSKMENKNIPAQVGAPKTVFIYEKKTVNPSILQIHPLLKAAGAIVSNDVFIEFYSEFNFLETPVITEDGFVVTHAADVLGAQHLGIDSIDVVVMKNATEDNVIRFISFKDAISHGKNKVALSQMVKYLTGYLTTTEAGQQLASEFPTNKTRTIVAEILGCSTGTIQTVAALEKNNPALLGKIDSGEITADQAMKQIKATKTVPFVSRGRYDEVLFTNKHRNDPARFNLNSVVMKFDELGELNLDISGSSVTGSLNGQSIGKISQAVRCDYGHDSDSDSSLSQHVQSHVFLPVNDRFSIQIIIRDLDQLEDGEMAMAA